MKIGITGVHGAGKTTLLEEMRREYEEQGFSVSTIPEVARDCPHPLSTIKAQKWIWEENYRAEVAAQNSSSDVVISDRTLLDNIVYFRWVLDHEPSLWGEEICVFKHVVSRAWMKHYDRVIRLPLKLEYIKNDVGDALRPKDVKYAREIDKLFDEIVDPYVTEKR